MATKAFLLSNGRSQLVRVGCRYSCERMIRDRKTVPSQSGIAYV